MDRDDAFFLFNKVNAHPDFLPEDERIRVQRIECEVNAQPYPHPDDDDTFDVYVVHVPYNGEGGPIAVRTNVGEARTFTQVYNMNRTDTHAVLLGYTLDNVGEGTVIPVD